MGDLVRLEKFNKDFEAGLLKNNKRNSVFYRAKYNLNKQILSRLNNASSTAKRGAGRGRPDDVFHMQMSRGYCNVAPVRRKEHRLLHKYGPFFANGKYAKFVGKSDLRYWKGRAVIFPMSYINSLA